MSDINSGVEGRCDCINVEAGSYSNTVILGYYPIMREYAGNRIASGLSGYGICVDKCIADQVIYLWEHGVKTYGSCCGHNKKQGFINVGEDFNKAVAMGFEPYIFEGDEGRLDTVKVKPASSSALLASKELVEQKKVLRAALVEVLHTCEVDYAIGRGRYDELISMIKDLK